MAAVIVQHMQYLLGLYYSVWVLSGFNHFIALESVTVLWASCRARRSLGWSCVGHR